MKTLGEQLRAIRKARDESLPKAGAGIGISAPHLFNVEKNKTVNPNLKTLQRIALYFNIRIVIDKKGARVE